MAQILLNQLHLHAPTAFVRGEGFWRGVRAGMRSKPIYIVRKDAIRRVFEFEDNERRGFGGVIDAGFDGMRMPAKGVKGFGLHLLDSDFEGLAL